MSIRPLSRLLTLAWLVASANAKAAPPTSYVTTQVAPKDPMADFRERFNQGMDRYKAGQLTEAIGYWEPIYTQLGEQKGYRLGYNLGVAYAEQGDATRAAERLQAFLGHVDARRGHGETLEPIVQREEADARSRVAALIASKGRLQIEAGSPPRAVQIDASEARLTGFVAWVTPGEHTVTFAPGTQDAQVKRVTVLAGETLEVAPTPGTSAPPSNLLMPPPPGGGSATPNPNLGSGQPSMPRETEHPFSPALLVVSGALAVGAGIAAAKLDGDALSLFHTLDGQQAQGMPVDPSSRQNLDGQRTLAYGAIGVAIGLGVLTAGLATWYFVGTSEREIVVTPTGISGRF